MTQTSIREYTEAVRWRYLRSSKADKGKILDELTKVTGYHRKAVIRLLHRQNQPGRDKKRGRSRQYTAAVVSLRLIWCPTVATVPRTSTSMPSLRWMLPRDGPSVLGCGEGVKSGLVAQYIECANACFFSLLGFDSDNGSEFINQHLYTYCRREGITFTRSRSYKKNDSCHVEQKNWSVVRRLIGYDRYNSRAALEALNRIYDLLRLYINFFQPVMKLVTKTRHGAKVHKVYDTAQTPYQRLLRSGVLTEAKKQELAAIYHYLNPILLLKQINENLESLWKLAERPIYQQKKVKTYEVSVT